MTKFDKLFAELAQEQHSFKPAHDARCQHYAHKGLIARASRCGLIRIIDCPQGKWSVAHRVGYPLAFGGITAAEFAALA